MTKKKTSTMSMRIAPEVKELLVAAAEKERRTIANMVEWMILKYGEGIGLRLKPRVGAVRPATNRDEHG
jgi:DNA-directed RNA polymerase subunit L